MIDLASLVQQMIPLVKSTGAYIFEERKNFNRQSVETKALNSLVSYVDKTAEEKLVAGLSKLLPEAGFLTEEETIITEQKDFTWIIDPLDGTTNFIHDLPCYSISIALHHKKELLIGIVYEITNQECFYAWKDGGAWLNEQAIQVSKTQLLSDSLLATGFPYYKFDKQDQYIKALENFMQNSRGIRRFGSAAVDLAYTACGRFDSFFEYSLNPWDVAGGILIVQEAGGLVSDFKGGNNYLFGEEIIAGNSAIVKAVQAGFAHWS